MRLFQFLPLSGLPVSQARLRAIARQLLLQYGQNLRQLEARCLRSLFSGLGGVAIASLLLASGAAQALEATPQPDPKHGTRADQTILSFELGAGTPRDSGALKFSEAASKPALVASASQASNSQVSNSQVLDSRNTATSAPIPEAWWHQGEKSPLAVAIGSAEGTRDPRGGKTEAYHWHPDPGNGADNFGTFSYQHLPSSLTQAVQQQPTAAAKREVSAQGQLPEIADRAQIQRLRKFHDQLQQQAAARGIVMSRLEVINGLDLANQSEAAALWPEGYVDRLAQLKTLTDDPSRQILEARAWSYWNPDRQGWDAPGLGNTYANILQDQRRRYDAIQSALDLYPAASGSGSGSGSDPVKASAISDARLTSGFDVRSDMRSDMRSERVVPRAIALATMPQDAVANQIISFNVLQ